VRAARLSCALVLLIAVTGLAQDAAPVVRAIEVQGGTLYDLRAVERLLRVKPGSPLRRPAPELAELLERRYRSLGPPPRGWKDASTPPPAR
jgi:hypothetical protein